MMAVQSWGAQLRTVLLIAGETSHGEGEHEFRKGVELLAECLNDSGLPVNALGVQGWPEPDLLSSSDAVLLYSDGLDRHVAAGNLPALQRHVEKGKGLGVVHFALEPSSKNMAEFFDDTLGGHFVVDHSVNPVWTLEDAEIGQHAVTRGVVWEPVRDEWYYGIRFVHEPDAVLIRTIPPLDSLGADGPRSGNPQLRAELKEGVPQAIAWVRTADSGARTFAVTGGHFHHNWSKDGFRTLVLNAAAWMAGLEVPDKGIPSDVPQLTLNSTIDEAIARGDAADVERHLKADPDSLHRGAHPELTPIQQAVLRRRAAISIRLIEAGAEVDQTDGRGRTLLHMCVKRDMPEVAAKLLQHGADPHMLDEIGWTPMHHAAAQDQVEMVRNLIEGGADPSTRSRLGGTALHEAAASGGREVIQIILCAGTDPSIIADTGETALDVALEYENEVAVNLLKSRVKKGE